MRPRYLPPDTARGRGPQGVVSASGAAERPPRAPVIESAPCGCASRRRPAHACAHEVQRTPGPLPGLTRAFFDPRGRCRDDRGDARTAVSCPPPPPHPLPFTRLREWRRGVTSGGAAALRGCQAAPMCAEYDACGIKSQCQVVGSERAVQWRRCRVAVARSCCGLDGSGRVSVMAEACAAGTCRVGRVGLLEVAPAPAVRAMRLVLWM